MIPMRIAIAPLRLAQRALVSLNRRSIRSCNVSTPRFRTTTTVASISGSGASTAPDVYSLSPKTYDIAFSFRDFDAEAAFIVEAHAKLSSPTSSSSSSLCSFLEVGCGPARHALLLAESGITKRCVGVDLSPEMVEYAEERAKELGLQSRTQFLVADMTQVQGFKDAVIENNELFDAAAIMLGTFSHCLDNDRAIATLKNVAECVRPGGILLIELGNPRDIYQGAFCMDGFLNVWEIGESGDVDFAEDFGEENSNERGDTGTDGYDNEYDADEGDGEDENDEMRDVEEMRVMVEYGREGDHFDVERGILSRTTGFSLFDVEGELVSSSVSVVDQRQFTLQELDLLARLSGWRLLSEGVYGDFDFDVSLGDDAADRMIVVLRRE